MSRIVAYVLALALSGQVVSAAELKLPISAAYGSPAGCFHFGYGGQAAVYVGGDYPPPYPPAEEIRDPEDIIIIDEYEITAVEMICKPLQVDGQTALMKCHAEDANWIERATFIESGRTLTFSSKVISGDLDKIGSDTWGPDTYNICTFDEKG